VAHATGTAERDQPSRCYRLNRTLDGRQVKMLNVIDEHTRQALAVRVDHNIGADDVVAHAVADWCAAHGTATVFIDPGSPWQNAWIESFNGRLRDELLNLWHFDSLLEAQVLIGDWRIDYNNHRPHSAHGDPTPTEYARAWAINNQPQPHSRWTNYRGPLSVSMRHPNRGRTAPPQRASQGPLWPSTRQRRPRQPSCPPSRGSTNPTRKHSSNPRRNLPHPP